MSAPKPVVLCILDGWGLSETSSGNAPALANTPTIDSLMATCPNSTLITHGEDVGLPGGQMGNSEIGHLNIGAGRVMETDLHRIDMAINKGEFAKLPGILRFAKKLKMSGGTAHLLGVLSDGGVHSHIGHMIATTHALAKYGIPVAIHAFTDGRDVPPSSAKIYLEAMGATLPEGAFIATVSGRYYAMDRDNRWERVRLAYEALSKGKGYVAPTAGDGIDNAYSKGRTDEFIKPRVLGDYKGMKDGDGILCLNFRADRARAILASFADPEFDSFDTGPRPRLASVTGFTEYSRQHNEYMDCIFPEDMPVNTLPEWISKRGGTQFHIAETEKYPHVTFFLAGGREEPVPGEDRLMAPSQKVATYDLKPEMSESEVTGQLLLGMERGYDFIVGNYANPDMVGHTGDLNAAILACEAVDHGLGRILARLREMGGAMIVTSDHGNCETMIDPSTGEAHTAHTTNAVPVILVDGPEGATLRHGGRLADIAPTILQLMNLPKPEEMTGSSLIRRKSSRP